MPRQLVRATDHQRKLSVGWLAVAWMEFFVVHGPGDVQGEPVTHTDEQTEFIVDCYATGLDGRRLYDSAFYSRPKGCDKSGLGARFALFEALGPCRATGEYAVEGDVYRDPYGLGFVYHYQEGEPLARHVKVPVIRCMATEEGQTGNVYDTVHFNLNHGLLAGALNHSSDAGLSRVILPDGGEILPSTASSASKDGGKETFVDFDESHLYNTPVLRKMYVTVTRNLRKRKKIAETWYLETTTMFAPGEDSIAEDTYKLGDMIREGKTRRERLLIDHRWGDLSIEDFSDETKLRAALVESYGDALAWNDLDGLVNEFYLPTSAPADSIRYFLNGLHSSADAWLMEPEIVAATRADRVVSPGETITLGFDGSRGRIRGKPDATALVGCCIEDGHLFIIGLWEASDVQATWPTWEPPLVEINAAVKSAFDDYNVVGFYADPAKDWRSHVNDWEAKYHKKVKLRQKSNHPFEWWMTGGRASLVEQAILQLEGAFRTGDATHSGEHGLVRHLRSARRRLNGSKLALGKENDYSPMKIDAAVASVLAYQACLDAVASGARTPRRTSQIIRVR